MSTIWLKKIIQEKTIVEVQSHQRHRNLTTYDILSIRSRQKLVTTEHLIFTHHPQLSNHSKRYTLKAQPWTKHHSTGRKTETLAVVFLRNICLISLSLHRPSFSTATTATDSIQRLSTTVLHWPKSRLLLCPITKFIRTTECPSSIATLPSSRHVVRCCNLHA